MDMGKYVAVGVLAVIVLAAATYDKPQTKAGQEAAQAEAAEAEPVYAVDYGVLDQTEAAITSAVLGLPVTPIVERTGMVAVAGGATTQVKQAKQKLEYVVKAHQTLSDVAEEVFGDRNAWRKLYEANKDRLSDPNHVRAGMKLVYEKLNGSQQAPARTAARAPRRVTSVPASARRTADRNYTVRKGETLYRIAKAQLGSGGRWKEIAELNRLDGATVRVNQVLLLPKR